MRNEGRARTEVVEAVNEQAVMVRWAERGGDRCERECKARRREEEVKKRLRKWHWQGRDSEREQEGVKRGQHID